MSLLSIKKQLIAHPSNAWAKKKGYKPLYTASKHAKIVIIGQAPGIRAQESGIPWDDKSGDTLREWLGVTKKQFHDKTLISLLPMDFYYPGKGKTGDKPPRKDFASLWHPQILDCMPNITLTILVGQYAQKHYLAKTKKRNLTETVRAYKEYTPEYFPTVHPSPLNFRWKAKNPWFEEHVIPDLQRRVANILN